jgi:heterodisulfide reductase subunit A
MEDKARAESILVIGAGIAGMKASLMLAGPSRKVFLVEKLPIIGGKTIKNEESFPNMECSTCMVAPIQQAVLQNPHIETLTYSSVESIEGSAGDFSVTVRRKARHVSLEGCIGCGMCYEVCPVSLPNEWEENLIERKAIYVPCSGSLPNVPVIDAERCLRLNGTEECSLCAESCAFEAILLEDADSLLTLSVGAVVIAAGSQTFDLRALPRLGYGTLPGVYSPMEFERLFASNGPTMGAITLRESGAVPERVAIVHCVGREEQGYCSGVCCMSSFKFARFLKHKLPDVSVFHIHSDLCVPGKSYQDFFRASAGKGTEMLFTPSIADVEVSAAGQGLRLSYPDAAGKPAELEVDMVILAAALTPDPSAVALAELARVDLDDFGFVRVSGDGSGSMETSRPGIFVAGTAEGPKDIRSTVIQAQSVAGQVVSLLNAVSAAGQAGPS